MGKLGRARSSREGDRGRPGPQRGEMLFPLPHRTCSAAIFSSSPGPAKGLGGQRQVGGQVMGGQKLPSPGELTSARAGNSPQTPPV